MKPEATTRAAFCRRIDIEPHDRVPRRPHRQPAPPTRAHFGAGRLRLGPNLACPVQGHRRPGRGRRHQAPGERGLAGGHRRRAAAALLSKPVRRIRERPGRLGPERVSVGQLARRFFYERIARTVFRRARVQRFLLEYDDARSGSFEPLKEVPEDKLAVLGLITTKRPHLEPMDELVTRIREASHFCPWSVWR
jgi:hypothetical protein